MTSPTRRSRSSWRSPRRRAACESRCPSWTCPVGSTRRSCPIPLSGRTTSTRTPFTGRSSARPSGRNTRWAQTRLDKPILNLGALHFLEEFESFKGFVKVMSNEMIGISVTIAHWYDIWLVIQYPPVCSRAMALRFQKFFACYWFHSSCLGLILTG